MVQGDAPFFVEELPTVPEFAKRGRDRDARDGRDGNRGQGGRGSRGPSEGSATYRIAVGRRQRVQPGSIVGALANEGGFHSSQIGGIDIRSDFSLVELPAELSSEQWKALSRTRIGGELIKLELDSGRRSARDGDDGGSRGGRGGDWARGGRDRGSREGDWGGRGNRGQSRERHDDWGDRGGRGGFAGSRRSGSAAGGARRFGGSRG
jgi:ATP-dependent RNA helicase DeaD